MPTMLNARVSFAMLVLAFILALVAPGLTSAQTFSRVVTAGPATLNAQNSACLTTNCLSINLGGLAGVSLQLAGTCGTCTANFESSIDGTNFVAQNLVPAASTTPASSASAAGVWTGNPAAAVFRVRLSAWASGSFSATIRAILRTLPIPLPPA